MGLLGCGCQLASLGNLELFAVNSLQADSVTVQAVLWRECTTFLNRQNLKNCIAHQIRRTNPSSVARVFRTRSNTRIIARKGIMPATTTMASKAWPPAAWCPSEKWPISKKAMIVPMPAPVPLIPLTEATDSLLKRSDGNTLAIVENAA